MKKYYKIILVVLFAILAIILLAAVSRQGTVAILDPKGIIAIKEKNLIYLATALMLAIVIPVFVLTFFITWRYQEGNKKASYTPDWGESKLAETLWWGLPFFVVLLLSVVIWRSSHDVDPFKKLASPNKPITIRVVALQWKWLFIYPEQNIATVNYLQFPEDTPVNFEITADAPMNSFWIPQLGGQMYAMTGMTTKLHLMANEQGDYRGSSANMSGEGFADMNFIARASSATDFQNWVSGVRTSSITLSEQEYAALSQPKTQAEPILYSGQTKDLYQRILSKYNGSNPGQHTNNTSHQ